MYKKMDEYVSEFTDQLNEALRIAAKFSHAPLTNVNQVLICGLGGSGIGATILQQLTAGDCRVPITISKDYGIPAHVNQHTLVIGCSYSGNTEETLEALEAAASRGATIAAITSGGKLKALAEKRHWPHTVIPAGIPPRAALAYSLVQLYALFTAFGFIPNTYATEVGEAIALIETHGVALRQEAHALAAKVGHRIPVIYAAAEFEGVGTRWRQQINENAKTLGWTMPYPEMTHNELVGWRTPSDQLAVIFLKTDGDHPRTQVRMRLTEQVYAKYTECIATVKSRGSSKLSRALYLNYIGDWFSVYLADIKKFDAVEVEVIDWLKGELAAIA